MHLSLIQEEGNNRNKINIITVKDALLMLFPNVFLYLHLTLITFFFRGFKLYFPFKLIDRGLTSENLKLEFKLIF